MKKEVSLVLSGGGARGLAHIGAIRELESRGYRIVALAGTSIGALVGAAYASGHLDALEHFLVSLNKDDMARLLDFTFSERGLVKGDRIMARLRRLMPDCRIEDLPVPLAIVASDLVNGEERVYRRGSVYRAIRASASLPGLLTPAGGHRQALVDGGVLNPLPLDRVERVPGSLLVAVNLYASTPPGFVPVSGAPARTLLEKAGFMQRVRRGWDELREWRGGLMGYFLEAGNNCGTYAGILKRSIGLMMCRMAEQSIALHRPDVLVAIPMETAGPLDFHKAAPLVELGKECMSQALEAYKTQTVQGRMARWWKLFFKKKKPAVGG